MKVKLLFATGNDYKFHSLQEWLRCIPEIELVSPKMLNIKVDVKEDGKTAVENAIKKAKAYYEITKLPTLTDDAGLFIENFPENEQPGLYVKRIDGIDGLSNDEIVDRYINKLKKYGEESFAHYFDGLCLIDKEGNIHSKSLVCKDFILTPKKNNKKSIDGGILECISFDIEANKYFDDRTYEESIDYDFDKEYVQFIKDSLNLKTTLLFATGNEYKFNLMKKRLEVFNNLKLVNPKMLDLNINVVEDGKTAEENSIKKAKAYYEATGLSVIAEDSGLFIDKFKIEEQPGLFVKRVNGKEGLSDEEVFNYYLNKITEYGGESRAHYFTGVALIEWTGKIHSNTICESDFLLTNKICKYKAPNGGVLEPMSFDIKSNKYFDERTPEEKAEHYKNLDEKYRKMIRDYIL